jgi:hypothetical protein
MFYRYVLRKLKRCACNGKRRAQGQQAVFAASAVCVPLIVCEYIDCTTMKQRMCAVIHSSHAGARVPGDMVLTRGTAKSTSALRSARELLLLEPVQPRRLFRRAKHALLSGSLA